MEKPDAYNDKVVRQFAIMTLLRGIFPEVNRNRLWTRPLTAQRTNRPATLN